MCGRWATPFTKENIEVHYKVTVSGFTPSYNIVPGQEQIVITKQVEKKAEKMRWGLIPHWSKDPKIGYKMINARAETITEKPSYRMPFTSQRCLIPCGGFYEWKKSDTGKVPHYIHLKDSPLFSLAGLYDTWRDPNGKEIPSFTIITTTPNSVMSPIHDRMPVILCQDSEDIWLSSHDVNGLQSLLRPYDNEKNMETYVVSKDVNDPKNDVSSNITAIQN